MVPPGVGSTAQTVPVDIGQRAGASVASCERLAAIELDVIGREDLLRAIETEAIRLFGLRSAHLDAGGRLRGGAHIAATPSGFVIQLSGGRLVGEGDLAEECEAQARIFAAQVSSLLRAHEALTANRSREDELSSLYRTVGQLTAQLDVQEVLRTVVERARELLVSDVAYIMLLDPEGQTLTMRVVTGNRTPTFAEIRRPVRAGVSTQIGATVQSADFLNEPGLDHDSETDRLARLEGIKSVLGVPLRTELSVLGTLFVANRHMKTFSDREVSVLESLGEHASLALDNARLYEEAISAASTATAACSAAETHLRRLRRVDEVHHRLTDVLLAGEGVAGVAVTLAQAFSCGIFITDWRHRLVAKAGALDQPQAHEPPAVAFMRRRDVREALAVCAGSYMTARIGSEYLVTPIAARRELLGYIWSACPADQETVDILKTSIEQAARVVALEMLREREGIETERRLRRDVMYELLSARPAEMAIIEPRARQVWPRFGQDHRPLIAAVTARAAVGGNPIERARRLLAEDRPADFVTVHGRHLVALTPRIEREEVLQEAQEILDLLARNGLEASIAVGAVCRSLPDTRESILAARDLLELLAPRKIVWAEGLEALTVLFDSTQRDRLRTFIERALAPLEGRETLIQTVQAYYEAGGNRAGAARRLGIHVNTLRQRLERIESLLGGSIDESIRAVPLRFALLARS
jgi:hypothetical protein